VVIARHKVSWLRDVQSGLDSRGELLWVECHERADFDGHAIGKGCAGLFEPAAMECERALADPVGGLGGRAGGVLQRSEDLVVGPLDDDRVAGCRHEVEDESLEFQCGRFGRFDPLPAGIDGRDQLLRNMEWEGLAVVEYPLEKGEVEDMDGHAAGPDFERPVGGPPRGGVLRQVDVLNNLQLAVDRYGVAHTVPWRGLRNDHRGHL
jgi:hypothetical protein